MAGPLLNAWNMINKLFPGYNNEIIRILRSKRAESESADNAGLIGTYNASALLKPAQDLLAAHIADKNNPHQETIDSIGSYSNTEMMAKLGKKIPNSILPISSFGIIDRLSNAQILASFSASGFVLTSKRAFVVELSGTRYTIAATSIDLNGIEAAANKTFNVYVRSQFGIVSLQARTDSPPESASVMYIGSVVCGPSAISSMSFYQVCRFDTFRLWHDPVGSAIPVTKGSHDTLVKLDSAWNPL